MRRSPSQIHSRIVTKARLVLVLIAVLCGPALHAAEWTHQVDVKKPAGNITLPSTWKASGSLTLKFEQSTTKDVFDVTLQREKSTASVTVPGKDPVEIKTARFYDQAMPAQDRATVTVVVKIRPAFWAIYIDDQRAALLPPLLLPKFSVSQPTAEIAAGSEAAWLQRISDFEEEEDFLIADRAVVIGTDGVRIEVENATAFRIGDIVAGHSNGARARIANIEDNTIVLTTVIDLEIVPPQLMIVEARELGTFTKQSGTWQLRTVLDEALEQETSDQLNRMPPHEDLSANFYSLAGTGSDGIVTAGHPFYDDYSISASVHLVPEMEAGLIFHYRGPERYYAFTITTPRTAADESILRLWRCDGGNRKLLRAVATKLTPHQWVMPMVEARQNRITCHLDRVEVIDVVEALPVGGQYGLFVNGRKRVRFDDTHAESLDDINLATIANIEFFTRAEHGDFLPSRRNSKLGAGELDPAVSRHPQWLVLGGLNDKPHVFSARFQSELPQAAMDTGLLVGYTGADVTHLRFQYQQIENDEVFTLHQVMSGVAKPLQNWTLPMKPIQLSKPPPVTLMADASNGRELRLYRNNELVLVHHHDKQLVGASGVFTGENAQVTISGLRHFGERNLHRNQFEKHNKFKADPYMRDWSSPEGDWIPLKGTTEAWHKSDFFGRFAVTIPFVEAGHLHLGVPENETIGDLRLDIERSYDEAGASTVGTFKLVRPGHQELSDVELATGSVNLPKPIAPPKKEKRKRDKKKAETSPTPTAPPLFTLHCEGHTAWVMHDGKEIAKAQLDRPLRGTRMRIDGYTGHELASSRVDRFQVTDYLFTKAPRDWRVNGGKWQVINRFECNPAWSHWNGQAEDSFGGMWTKLQYAGDFSVEIYAGTRQGFYSRCGDINLTMMSPDFSPSRGYTVTCTGWDFDQSQLYTKFYRDGELIDQSDALLLPRNREGNRRAQRNLLTHYDRPVHGAWFYIKLRRIGDKLEYWFDNELLFTSTDQDVIKNGPMGLWTFLNSIVVARVKIAAEEITVPPLRFHRHLETKGQVSEVPLHRQGWYSQLQENGAPIQTLLPNNWTPDDPVGQSQITWHKKSMTGPYFVLTNVAGSGSMHAKATPTLPMEPLSDLAGWSFTVKRTDDAQFNFHYTVGIENAHGKFEPKKRFFHRISGTDFSKGALQMSGTTEVRGISRRNETWHERSAWSEITVWLPLAELEAFQNKSGARVRIDGFGNLQPSYILQGLHGNRPGASYAVANLVPIRYRPPRLGNIGNEKMNYVLLNSATTHVRSEKLAAVNKWINAQSNPGLHDVVLRAFGAGNVLAGHRLLWITEPKAPSLTCTWDEKIAGAIRLQHTGSYRDRRLARLAIKANEKDVLLAPDGFGTWLGRLPLNPSVAAGAGDLSLAAKILPRPDGDQVVSIELPALKWADAKAETRPRLLSVGNLTRQFETFESMSLGNRIKNAGSSSVALAYDDSGQGTVLQIKNRMKNQRLQHRIDVPFSLARFPLFQFRYRAGDMTNISLRMGANSDVALSEENFDKTVNVRYATAFDRSGKWNVWMGMLADGLTAEPYDSKHFFPQHVKFGSLHKKVDQTGHYSQWEMDDIIFGPAVSSSKMLKFTPDYFDWHGVAAVYCTIIPGELPYDVRPEEERNAIDWGDPVPNRQEQTPAVKARNGVNHLLLKAVNTAGKTSTITDIPFMIDKTPLSIATKFVDHKHPAGNGKQLDISFQLVGGAPVAVDRLRFKIGDEPYEIEPFLSNFVHKGNKDTLQLNWPYVLRRQLNNAKDGDTVQFTIDKITDGAGNSTTATTVDIPINYAEDKTGPAWLPATMPATVLFRTAWEGLEEKPIFIQFAKNNKTKLIHEAGKEPFVRSHAHGRSPKIKGHLKCVIKDWRPERHPYLALRFAVSKCEGGGNLSIALALQNNEVVNIPLRGTAPGELAQPAVPDCENEKWVSLILDVGRFLQEHHKKMKARDPASTFPAVADITIKRVDIVRDKMVKKSAIDIQDLYILAKWKAKDRIELDGYDASGVAHTRWQLIDPAGTVLDEGNVRGDVQPLNLLRDKGPGWLLLQQADKAGNLGVPIRVPVPNGL